MQRFGSRSLVVLGLSVCVVAALVSMPVTRSSSAAVIALAESGGMIAAGNAASQIVILDDGGKVRHVDLRYGTLNDLRFSPDGTQLAVANQRLALLNLETQKVRWMREDDRNYGLARFSPDRQSLLTINGESRIEVIDLETGSDFVDICCSTIYGEADFAPDVTQILTAGHWPRLLDSKGQLIRAFAASREIETLRPIAFEPTGNFIFMGSQDGRVYMWDFVNGSLESRSPARPGYVDTIAVLRQGWVAYAHFGGPVHLWNPITQETRTIEGAHPTSNIVRAGNRQTGEILFGTAAGTVERWSTLNGKLISRHEVNWRQQ